MSSVPTPAAVPLWMVAELTYRCPLHCPFCSNPVDFAKIKSELSTAEWCRIFAEARALGAMIHGASGKQGIKALAERAPNPHFRNIRRLHCLMCP